MQTTPTERADTRPALSPAKVAVALGISRSKIYDLLDEGAIPSFRVGTARRVRTSDLESYIEERIEQHG